MFWKTKQPRSLALRLSVWYAGSAFLLLAAGTGFLYWELTQNFEAEDNQYLAEKANTLTKLLKAGDLNTLKWEVEGESSVRPGVNMFSRVFTRDGRILLESTGMSDQLPATVFPADGEIESGGPEPHDGLHDLYGDVGVADFDATVVEAGATHLGHRQNTGAGGLAGGRDREFDPRLPARRRQLEWHAGGGDAPTGGDFEMQRAARAGAGGRDLDRDRPVPAA